MGLLIEIKVVPSSGRQKCVLEKSGQLKCYLKNPPEKGKANAELISMIAKALKQPKKLITIEFGTTSRKKRLKIDCDIRFEDLLNAFGIEYQLKI